MYIIEPMLANLIFNSTLLIYLRGQEQCKPFIIGQPLTLYSILIQDSQYKRQPFTGWPRLTACTSVMFRTHSTSGSLSTIVHFSLALIIKTQCMRRLHPDYSRCLTLITGRPLGDRSAAPTQESLYITTLVILSMQNNFIVSFRLYEGSSSNSCKLTGLSH